jgi:hypothetical protein
LLGGILALRGEFAFDLALCCGDSGLELVALLLLG